MTANIFRIFSLLLLLNISSTALAMSIPGTFSTTGGILEAITLPGEITDNSSFSIKRGEPYDEKKDPALRKGTENQEEPQLSFFIIPLVMFVGMGLFLYYNKL